MSRFSIGATGSTPGPAICSETSCRVFLILPKAAKARILSSAGMTCPSCRWRGHRSEPLLQGERRPRHRTRPRLSDNSAALNRVYAFMLPNSLILNFELVCRREGLCFVGGYRPAGRLSLAGRRSADANIGGVAGLQFKRRIRQSAVVSIRGANMR